MIRVNHKLLKLLHRLQHKPGEGVIAVKSCSPADIIIAQEQYIHSVFVIKSGLAKCYRNEDNGKCFVQEFFGAGELFGEIEALQQKLSFSTISAISQLELYQIRQDDFLNLLRQHTEFNLLIMNALAEKVRYKALRHAHNQSHTAAHNLRQLIKSNPDLIKQVSKADIASYLGITIRSLNRILNDSAVD